MRTSTCLYDISLKNIPGKFTTTAGDAVVRKKPDPVFPGGIGVWIDEKAEA